MSDDHVNPSAETGQFVSDDEAADHPATTVRESVEPADHEHEIARLHEEIATLTEECRNRAAWSDTYATERDGWIRAFNRLDATVSHHQQATRKAGFEDTHDEALYAARARVLRSVGPTDATLGESVADDVNAPLPELVGFDTAELYALDDWLTRSFAPVGVPAGKPNASPLRTARYKIEQALAIEKRDMERARRHADDQGGVEF